MKKLFLILSLFLLNGCAETIALLGPASSAFSGGNIINSSLQSAASYGIKRQTGKTPLGHALTYTTKMNPEKKQETCISFIEKTRSEFCTIAKKQISLTNKSIKEKVFTTTRKELKTVVKLPVETVIKFENKTILEESNFFKIPNQLKKSPRELAIAVQTKLKKKTKSHYLAGR